MSYLDIIKKRRTIYNLGKNINLKKEEIELIIKSILRELPSAFNSQTSRIVILFDKQHAKLWDITKNELKKIVDVDAFESTENKINSFMAGFGTILFYEEQKTVEDLQQKYPLYAEYFPSWSLQSTGMALVSIWTALAEKGIGASIQHYNPLIDDAIAKEWNISSSWVLTGQMPFGSIEGKAKNKDYLDISSRVISFE